MLIGLTVVMVLLASMTHEVKPTSKWIPVLAEVTGLRLIRTHSNRNDSAAGSWLVQYHLSYQFEGLTYSNLLLVQAEQPMHSVSLTTSENEYWLLTEEQASYVPIQVWINSNHPEQIR